MKTQPLKKLIIIAVLSIAAVISMKAQEKIAEKEGPSFTCIQWDKLPYSEVFYKKGKEMKPLPLRIMRRSLPLHLDASGVFELYIQKTGEKGLPVYNKIASAEFPKEAERVLFILDQIENSKPEQESIQITVLEDNLQNFPKGSFKFLNTTDQHIKIQFSDKPVEIQPNRHGVVKPDNQAEGFLPIRVFDENDTMIYQNQLHFDPVARELAIIKHSGTLTEKIDFKFVSEIIKDEPAPKK